PGRKAVIWATGGFPFSISDTSMELAPLGRESYADVAPLYERTWKAINDANFAIYPIDLKGLNPFALFDAATRPQNMNSRNPAPVAGMVPPIPNPGPWTPGPWTPGPWTPGPWTMADWAMTESQATIEAFAHATGGKAYYNGNDLVKGFRQAAKDSGSYYLL